MSETTVAPLRAVLWEHFATALPDHYYERLECGHDWAPTWRNTTGSYRSGFAFSKRRRCQACAVHPKGE